MNIKETGFEGCYIIKPKVFDDDRGFFLETFNQEKFEKSTVFAAQFWSRKTLVVVNLLLLDSPEAEDDPP